MAKSSSTKFVKKQGVLSEAEEVKESDVTLTPEKEVEENNTTVENAKEEVEVDNSEGQDTFSPNISDDVDFTPTESKEKEVKVRLNSDFNCCIGGERHYFKKDKVYSVNPNLKRILNKSGLLKPLN